ncbi:carbon storage regulator CsrA [Texcoconibacillus texcoconensis]|uniref:Translational regulator CsrA n=1 Tax=Texcoconibacillus texcoconensis TaxID=1095777 RepID=A0A840QQZ8_9BACI|nr:carbon storage regulator CsrA [Texcoconibacillus texcoconensis]MBB5173758.1 carbon storage regulator [Texcoconibacillus texcoconensis]
MLVLTRKANESIQIGDDIEVKILAIEGEQIKLGINAPKNVDIHRKEVYLAIQEENNVAAQDASLDALTKLTLQLETKQNDKE